MALDVARSLAGGLAIADKLRANERQSQIQGLQQNIASSNTNPLFNPDVQKLTGLDPQLGAQSLSTFNALSDGRKKAFFDDAKSGLNMLNQGNFDGVMGLISNRRQLLNQIGGDTSDVDAVANSLKQGDIQGAKSQLEQAVFAGIDQGFLSDPLERQERQQRVKGRTPALSDAEKNFNRITGLRQQLSSAEKSGSAAAIKAATQQLNDFQQISGKFGLGAQEKSDVRVSEAANKELSKQAAIASKDAFDSMKGVRKSVGNMTDAIRALNKGADTGPIISKLPSFRESTIELDNIRGKMGLDIVGATTFGALSESELKFALNVALPDNLQPEALKQWLTQKRDAQRKLGKELLRAATFLGKPGNTISKYIEKETSAGRLSFEPVTGEDDITKVSDQDLLSF